MRAKNIIRAAAMAAAIAVAAASPAMAKQCSPKDTSARILQSANANDVHPQWRGESHIGTGWWIVVDHTVTRAGVRFLSGELFSPRGNAQGQIYAVASEWYC